MIQFLTANPQLLLELACMFCAAGISCLAIGWMMTVSRLDQAEEKIARLLAMRVKS